MSVGSLNDRTAIEYILELDFIESAQITLQSYLNQKIHKNDERSPGMRSG
jgi:hypothetical protein